MRMSRRGAACPAHLQVNRYLNSSKMAFLGAGRESLAARLVGFSFMMMMMMIFWLVHQG